MPTFIYQTPRIAVITSLLCALLNFVPTSHAKEKIETADLNAYKELSQARLESTRDLLQKDIQAFSARIETQDKRLDTQNAHIDQNLSLLGIVLAVFGLVLPLAGLAGYFSVAQKAKKEAQNEAQREAKLTANDWFEAHASELQSRLDALQFTLQQLEGQAESNFNSHLQRVQDGADLAIKGMQQSVSKPTIYKTVISEGAATALSEAAIAATNKPESTYTFRDWNNRAFDAYRKGDKERAASFWRDAAGVDFATPEEISQALLNVGAVLTDLKRYDEAIASYDEYIRRFDDSETKDIRLGVITALSQKAACLSLIKRYEESISVCDIILKRLDQYETLTGSEQVARALVHKAMGLEGIKRNEEALEVCENFIKRFDHDQTPEIRKLYIALLNRKCILLSEMGRLEEADKAYEHLMTRFGSDENSEFKPEIAKAKNTKGFRLLCQAKKIWNELESRTNYLHQAETLFSEAIVADPSNALVLGNQAYCAHLSDRSPDIVRERLRQAIIMGGKWIYDATLGDLAIDPVPSKDGTFRALLDEIWETVRVSIGEKGVRQDPLGTLTP